MADDTLRLGIEADASGVDKGVRDAEKSLDRLGDSVDREAKNLNRYGEKLGKAFGPGEGLHGRLTELETPLRDSEGAFARAQMAVIEFGNEGATAADKIGAGFLLAGDSIAAFASGGVVGLAIAAGVAGISLLTQTMGEEAEAAKEAEEAQKKHADELKNLAKSAASANATIALLNAKQRKQEAIERARALEQEVQESAKRYEALAKQHNEEVERFNNLSALAQDKQESQRLDDQAAELDQVEKHARKLQAEYDNLLNGRFGIRHLNEQVQEEQAKNSENLLTQLVDSFKAIDNATATATEKVTKQRAKAATQNKKEVFDEAKFERQVRKDNAAFDLQTAQQLAEAEREIRFAAFAEQAAIDLAAHEKRRQLSIEEAAFAKKLAEERTQMAMAATNTVTGALFEQAKAGELNAAALLEAVLASTGQELVARGTLHAFEGVATANPVMAGTGAAMIASGLAMGAASGAVSRAGQPAASPSSTPTDTRQSRAASTAGGSEGGTTVINFNGPAYDRRGVANVLNAGQKMARHRRVMGA